MKAARRRAWLLALLLFAGGAGAHPLAPALLELRATAPGDYAVLWRMSTQNGAGGGAAIGVAPELPEACVPSAPLRSTAEPGALVTRWRVRCTPADLVGLRIGASGLPGAGIDVIVQIAPWQQAPVQALLSAARPQFAIAGPVPAANVFRDYLRLGIDHLLGGLDHLLFVAGLVLLVRRPRRLLATVTAFTAGHSVTLSLAALGIVHIDQRLAELGIAISILLLAGELARPADAAPSAWARWPWRMAAAFGLLHGLGFAGALAGIGLPAGQIPLALLAFNLGIEIGQIGVVVALLLAAVLVRRLLLAPMDTVPRRAAAARLLPAYAIGIAAAYWCCDRALRLLGV